MTDGSGGHSGTRLRRRCLDGYWVPATREEFNSEIVAAMLGVLAALFGAGLIAVVIWRRACSAFRPAIAPDGAGEHVRTCR